MNRRVFARTSLGAMAGLGFAGPGALHGLRGLQSIEALRALRVDGARLNGRMEAIRRFGLTESGGLRRVAFSDADLAGRAFVRALMEEAGLSVSVDPAGNLIGSRGGTAPGAGTDAGPLGPIMLGSHIDSVPEGGHYDGQVGSLAAVEVAQILADAGVRTRYPLEFVIFSNEEGGKTGSRALAGEVRPFELDIETASGFTIGDGLGRLGGDPHSLDLARRRPGSVAGYLELHIEQGAILERQGVRIGVVEGIVGIRRWTVTVDGSANHAGTTPMGDRQDALVTAARIVQAVNEIALTEPGRQVATVGRIDAQPGAPNVIPGRVEMSLEIRDLTMERIDEVFGLIRARSEELARADGTRTVFEEFYVSRAAPTAEPFRVEIEAACDLLELSRMRMPSGAGHDAQSIALLGPTGMIFVPSAGGISHSPREFTSPADVEAGANVLLQTLLRLDGSLPGGGVR